MTQHNWFDTHGSMRPHDSYRAIRFNSQLAHKNKQCKWERKMRGETRSEFDRRRRKEKYATN